MNEKRELSAKILVLNEEKQKMNGFWLLLLKHIQMPNTISLILNYYEI